MAPMPVAIPQILFQFFKLLLKEDVCALMFSRTVTGFFLLCSLEDSNGNEEPCFDSPAGGAELWCSPPAPCLGAGAALRSGREGHGRLSSLLSSCP